MWHILKAELSYNKYLISGIFSLLLVIGIIEMSLDDAPNFLVLFVMFMVIQNWLILKNKENRDFQHARLPLAMRTVALARVLMVMMLCLLAIALYKFIHLVFHYQGPANYPIRFSTLIVFSGVMICGFTIYFILRDLLLFFLRNNRVFKLTKERSRTILMLIVLLLNLLGIYTFLVRPVFIVDVFKFFIRINLFAGEYGLTRLVITSIVLALLSVVTSGTRKNYLE